jgi:serine/threonine-protein kinase
MLRASCPDVRTLEALLGADGVGSEPEELVRHLETCVECQHLLQTLAADATVWEDAADGLCSTAREEAALRELLAQLKGEAPAVELSFLHPSAKPGLLGLLGPYEVQEEIGRGGMGVVLKAFDSTLNRVVAIKVLSPFLACSPTARRRFTREAKAAAAVCHDHVVTIHAVAEVDGLPYMVMQYVAGESLQARLDREGPLDIHEIVRIGLQTAQGLAAAHAQGLIHRDIKPANLLLEDGTARVRITDFGLARMSDDVQLTRDGVVAGTPEYMAPEQARGEAVDHRADLFSLGSVLYAMCTGTPPFRGFSAVAVLRRVSDDQPAAVRALKPDVPDWLEALICRLLTKDPTKRMQSAEQLAALLEGYLAHLRQPEAIPAPQLPLLWGQGRVEQAETSTLCPPLRERLPVTSFLTFVVMAACALGMVFWLLGGNAGTNQPAKGDVEARRQEHIALDFRERIEKLPLFTLFGPDLDQVVTIDARGLRIARPDGHTNQVTGADVPITLHGDFDISLGYELLAIGEPLPKYGAGIGLRVLFGQPPAVTVLLSRARKPAGEQFGSYKIVQDAEAKDSYSNTIETKATALNGRLRIMRIGAQLRFLVADGVPEYKLMRVMDIGAEDVSLVRLYATTTDRPVLLDVRFTDLDILADEIRRSTADAPSSSAIPTVPRTRPGSAVPIVLGLLLLVTLASALCAWFFVRRSRAGDQAAAQELGSDKPEETPPRLSFLCAACGKKLRFRAEMAGKSIKCPACSEVVRVPQTERGEHATDRT